MYDTILVPTDGSDGSHRAVQHAIDLAEHYDATLHALYVVDTRRYGEPALSSTELVVDDLEAEGEDLLREVASQAHDRGVDLQTRCCHGTPQDEILDYAADVDADLIVLGHQGLSHRRTIGSVVEGVTRTGDRPVLVA